MKKLNYILFAGLALLATACVSDEDDLFEESSAQRMNSLVLDNTELLEGSEYGWVFNYYIGHDDDSMGGIVHTMRFKDGKVYVRSEAVGDVSEAASLYQVKAEQECLLSFDTYNDYFHYWSAPQGSSLPDGYESDYEFCIKEISANKDTINLKGKKYGQYAQLIRLKEDGASYMEQILEMSDKVYVYPHNSLVVNGESYDITMDEGLFEYSVTSTDSEGDSQTDFYTISYITTLTGVHLYSPVTFGGVTFQDLIYDEESTDFVTEDGKARLLFVKPEGYIEYEEYLGNYTLVSTNRGTMNLTISEDGTGRGFYISGMTYNATNVYASYLTGTGNIQICGQRLDDWRTYQDWLLSYFGGYISWSTSLGMIGTLGEDEDGNQVITFKSNDGSTDVTSFMEYVFDGDPSGDTMAGYLTRYNEPFVFTKQ